MKPVKIVIIGAGSASFGLNSLATLLREPALRGSTLALVDTNAEGLRLVHRLAERMNKEWDAALTIESNTDRRAVLDGADFVVCSIEVGPREELWRLDWEVTLRHGLRQPYAENGGPGRFVAQVEEAIDIKAAGLNHFTWILDIRDRRSGEDLYPELRERFLAGPADREPLTRDMLRLTGYLPVPGDTHLSEYLPYTHNPATRPWERYNLHLYEWDRAARGRDEMWGRIERLVAEGGPELESLRHVGSEGVYEVVHGVAHDANIYRVAIDGPNNGAIS